MPSLPTTSRGSQAANLLPDNKAIEQCIELTRFSPDAAEYFAEGLKKRLSETKMIDRCTTGVMQPVEGFVENVKIQSDRQSPWEGNDVKTDFKNINGNIGNYAAEAMASSKGPFRLDIAINPESNFVRGFANAGESEKKHLDQLFNSWLAENDVVSKSSTLYRVDAEGETLKDEKGNPVKVSAEELRNLMSDVDKGFQQYCEKKDISLTARQVAYPDQKPKVEIQPQVEITPQAPAPQQPVPEVSPEVEPEVSPSTQVGGGM